MNWADLPARGFVALMKHYVVDYTNSHDQSQTERIMEEDYVLRMGEHVVVGRDGAYAAATRKQLDQFPGLVLTVHEIATNGERLAMRFSEHGASVKHGGAKAAWGGIALYSWNGTRLTANRVEQDYHSRARQLRDAVCNPVEPPAVAPWDVVAEPPDPEAEDEVRRWLNQGALGATDGVTCDDDWTVGSHSCLLDQQRIEILDLFSCGTKVAFHAAQYGTVRADFEIPRVAAGTPARMHIAGLVEARDGTLRGRLIRDRLGLVRSLQQRT